MGTSGSRRRAGAAFAILSAVTSLLVTTGGPAHAADGPLRVYVITIDGLRPAEVGPLTPNISALRESGTWYEQARAVFPAETLPNHVAMMTGVLPEDSGIIGNQFYVPNLVVGERRTRHYMDEPQFLDTETLVTRLERACDDDGGISTATVMSKTYLNGVFRGEPGNVDDPVRQREADFHWDAPFYIPQSDHILDVATMDAFRTWIDQQPEDLPQFAFVNLGDVDRSGHIDEAAIAAPANLSSIRQAAIEQADAQIGLLVEDLKTRGVWDDTVVIVNSDHGMDWGPQSQRVDPEQILGPYGYTNREQGDTGAYDAMSSGGAGFVYVHHKSELDRIATILSEAEGVDFVSMREPLPGPDFVSHESMGVDHPNSPDIMFFVEPGWHVDLLNGHQNPLPGNHAHPATQQSTLFVTGGHEALRDEGTSVTGDPVYPSADGLFADPDGGPGNLSVAPTVASLFGIGEPNAGYAVDPLAEAFDPGALSERPVCDPALGDPARTSSPPAPSPEGPPLTTLASQALDADRSHVTYRLTATNRGGSTADPVTVNAAVPNFTTFASSSPAPAGSTPSCIADAPQSTPCEWSLGAIAPGESKTVEVTYGIARGTGLQTQIRLASMVSAPDQPSVSNSDSTVTMTDGLLGESTFVDRDKSLDTNYGACDQLRVSSDGRSTAFIDYDSALRDDWTWSFQPKRPSFEITEARVAMHVLSTQYDSSNPGTFGLFLITDGDWDQGAGGCEGGAPVSPVNEALGGSKERVARSGWTPATTDEPVATTTVSGSGLVEWDITETVDTPEERSKWNGYEIRDVTEGSATGTTVFSDKAYPDATAPMLPQVIIDPTGYSINCVDADSETVTVGGNREVRVDVHAASGQLVTNGTIDTCSGDPYLGELYWQIEDDDPDSYIASTDGEPALLQAASNGGVGPDLVGSMVDEDGHSWATVRLARSTAEGTIRLGVMGTSGGALEEGENVFCGNLSQCTGESVNEDDVSITWIPEAPVVSTVLSFAPDQALQGQYSDPATFELSLADDGGDPVPNAPVSLSFADESYDGTTGADGQVAIPLTLAQRPDVYDIVASFAGSDGYEPSSTQGSFVVLSEDSALDLSVTGSGSRKTLAARLFDADTPGHGIEGSAVEFFANGTRIGSSATDGSGLATLAVPAGYRGPKVVFEARFAGDTYYLGSSDRT